MKNMTLENITKVCGGTYFGDQALLNSQVDGIVIDSRKIKKNDLFIPIRGEKVDGHSFINAVMEKGALACLSEEKIDQPAGPYILVESCSNAMQQIAAYYRESLSIPIVGITGSVGKTSTKEMIASVLKEKFRVHKTAGNFNNEIGLPLTIFDIRQEHQAAVLEMGISDFGEMHRLGTMAKPDICVITNIGLCHLENLKSRDGILKAKTEIFVHMTEGSTVILNGDDDKLSLIEEVNGKRPIFYAKDHGDAYVSGIKELGMEGIRMRLHLFGESAVVTIPIPGIHNIYNALAAACVGHVLGMELKEICRGIQTVETISGRSNFIKVSAMTIIDDCYNANPVSMCSSLDVLSSAKGRKIAVLGDMGELGADERQLHYDVGAYAAEKGIEVLFLAGSLAQEMAKGAEASKNGCSIYYFKERGEMTETLCRFAAEGDTILVKASHFMEYPKVVEALQKIVF